MYYTYVLRSKRNGKLYIGFSHDLKGRLNEHNKGFVKASKANRPWEVIYYEACLY